MSRGCRICGMSARTGGTQVAVVGEASTVGLAGQEAVRVHRDRSNVTFQARESGAGVLVGMARNRRHVIVRAPPSSKVKNKAESPQDGLDISELTMFEICA